MHHPERPSQGLRPLVLVGRAAGPGKAACRGAEWEKQDLLGPPRGATWPGQWGWVELRACVRWEIASLFSLTSECDLVLRLVTSVGQGYC